MLDLGSHLTSSVDQYPRPALRSHLLKVSPYRLGRHAQQSRVSTLISDMLRPIWLMAYNKEVFAGACKKMHEV